ncbi:MAG: DEAD/DEAH box helicase family protein [Candidatus Gastranaerophilales bacterium]|nr:DEAD/DEAH box helicase family protein [Candidatus Gastranaerophilales bacterium]
MAFLYEELEARRTAKDIGKIKAEIVETPQFNTKGLSQNFELRPYQIDAIARLQYVFKEKDIYFENKPVHLLFNMATGSGKTLLMAQNILYLYEKGYRNFIFFVHQNVILNKTRDNFLNENSKKYLFNRQLIFNSQPVKIREVNNFNEASNKDINIMFTTIHGLHSQINDPRENAVTLDSLMDEKIVMLADEAHHLNSDTSNNRQLKTDDEIISWESTVKKVLIAHTENVLLEYTATIAIENQYIKAKYEDKIIKKYGLKEFREDKYSKDIYLIKSELNRDERILLALLMSYYRETVAQENKVPLKPVVLIKSKTIAQSEIDKTDFLTFIKQLAVANIETIASLEDERVKKAFDYFEKSGISFDGIVNALKVNYIEENIRIVNSKSNDSDINKQKQLDELNNLENNNVRLIFTVNMLNEGWDVLNLFDIVRLDESNSNKTVTSDVQLIGRGCRYFPHKTEPSQEKYQRKFDKDINNDLRSLEEFYYHSKENNTYINSLKETLIKEGLQDNEIIEKKVKLKDNFKNTDVYKNALLLENQQIKKDLTKITSLKDYGVDSSFDEKINTKKIKSELALNIEESIEIEEINTKKMFIDKKILRKAINLNSFYFFNNLKSKIPCYESIEDFIEEFMTISIKLTNIPKTYDLKTLPKKEQLEILNRVLAEVEKKINKNSFEYEGSKEFEAVALKSKIKKVLTEEGYYIQKYQKSSIVSDTNGEGHSIYEADNSLCVNLKNNDWYIFDDFFGNSEEKSLIRFISDSIEKLKAKYNEVYLIRNQNLCKVYNFKNGKGFEPDFLLFMQNKDGGLNYQIFIEPKGGQLIKMDEWKEKEFLLPVNELPLINAENKQFKLIGLPFYNKFDSNEVLKNFEDTFKEKIMN